MPQVAPIVITGASSGIGRAAAHVLAREGHPLVLVCREGAKARAVQAEIIRVSGNKAVELETADLSSQAQIRAVAQSIRGKHKAISALINNAGVAFTSRHLSVDGIEMTFAVNHLAPFLLTNLLLDNLKAGAPSRVVTTTSDLQRPLRLDDLDRTKSYKSFDVYGETKLANILFTFELARRLAGTRVTANAVAPGFLRTALMRNGTPTVKLMFKIMSVFMMEAPEKGADRIVHATLSPDLAGTSGELFVKNQPAKASAPAYDTALAAQLWAVSERMTGLVPAPTTTTEASQA